jgi:hypothetical protein
MKTLLGGFGSMPQGDRQGLFATIVPDVPDWFTIPAMIVGVVVGLVVMGKVIDQFRR